MSNSLATLTRPERPPFRGGPPVKTTFDGGFNGEPPSESEVFLESAERLLKTVDLYSVDELDVLHRLLTQRQTWLQDELSWMRLMSGTSLPPIRGFDFKEAIAPSSVLESRLARMLNRLNEAILKVSQRMVLQKSPFPIPEL